jgi:hypothetical protein
MLQAASFTLIYDVYSADFTHDDRNLQAQFVYSTDHWLA